MKAKDLRIGNSIMINGEVVENISYIVISDLAQIENNVKNQYLNSLNHKPIKINEEWLIRHGFKEKENLLVLEIHNYSGSYLCFNKFSRQVRLVDSNGLFLTHDKLRYVHQVQNLYYFLRNKEL